MQPSSSLSSEKSSTKPVKLCFKSSPFSTFQELLMTTAASIHGAADNNAVPSAETNCKAEITALNQAQSEASRDDMYVKRTKDLSY